MSLAGLQDRAVAFFEAIAIPQDKAGAVSARLGSMVLDVIETKLTELSDAFFAVSQNK